MTDHPRSRGVYAAVTPASSSPSGSSPLARGLRRRRPSPARPDRIIPARAGFTSCLRWQPSSASWIIPARAGFTAACSPRDAVRRDHPRSRGVYGPVQAHQGVGDGSSPLARGLRAEVGRLRAADRIIPARAGFTSGRLPQEAAGQDHPRSRGVYHQRPRHRHAPLGSSPLARGLRGGLGRHVSGSPDHPRSRGVYGPSSRNRRRRGGSSPLARGLLLRPEGVGLQGGIIPARAGFTGGAGARPGLAPDHPRSRGVYGIVSQSSSVEVGSSPLARGLRADAFARRALCGIIPARAGFTRRGPDHQGHHRDHPRSRGVYL